VKRSKAFAGDGQLGDVNVVALEDVDNALGAREVDVCGRDVATYTGAGAHDVASVGFLVGGGSAGEVVEKDVVDRKIGLKKEDGSACVCVCVDQESSCCLPGTGCRVSSSSDRSIGL